jgi:hypothetical protein
MENRTAPAYKPKQADRPDPTGLGGQGGSSPAVPSWTRLFDFLLWSENFKGRLKRKMWFLEYSFSDYLIG